MASYSNYQLPNNYGSSQPQPSFASSAPPTMSTSNQLVPLYGPPPTMAVPPQPIEQTYAPPRVDDDGIDASIIASQQRALAAAKNGNSRNPEMAAPDRSNYRVRSTQEKPLSDAIHPYKYEMKKARQTKTAAGATSGAFVGGIIAGPAFPVGMIVGGAVGGYTANKVSKFGERRAQRKHEKNTVQRGANRAILAHSEGVAFA